MYVSIVILNYNGKRHLEAYLPSVLAHSKGHEIVIIDNASTDDSVTWLRKVYPEVRIVSLDKNYGFAGGYNRGLSQIDSDIYIIINSDVKVTPGWTQPLIDLLISKPDAAAVQPKIKSLQNPELFEYAGAAGGYIDKLGYPYCRGRIFETVERDIGQYDDCCRIFWTSGACMAIKANLFREVGGFDEAFFAHMEEIDLSWRLQLIGNSLYCQPASVVYHLGGGTLDYQSKRKVFLNFRNNLMTLTKNLPVIDLILVIPLRLVLDGVAGIRFLVKGQFQLSIQIIKAHFSYYAYFMYLIRKRKDFWSKYPVNKWSKVIEMFPDALIVDYFLLGRKYYRDIVR